MKNFDISIYGHLCFDNIFDGFNYRASIGAMGNVWIHLRRINPNLRVNLIPTDIGDALVLIDKAQGKRTSISSLSLYTQYPKIFIPSTVNHIMYINRLHSLSFIEKLDGFITADICNGSLLDLKNKLLKRINLLFISDEDCVYSIDDLTQIFPNVLLHRENGSTLYTKNNIQHFTANLVRNINVLGAGDKFAAHILAGLVEDSKSLPKIIQTAHEQLTDYFNNEKI